MTEGAAADNNPVTISGLNDKLNQLNQVLGGLRGVLSDLPDRPQIGAQIAEGISGLRRELSEEILKNATLLEDLQAALTTISADLMALRSGAGGDAIRGEFKGLVEQYRLASVQDVQSLRDALHEIRSGQSTMSGEVLPQLHHLQADINSALVSIEHESHKFNIELKNMDEKLSGALRAQEVQASHIEALASDKEQHMLRTQDSLANINHELRSVRDYLQAYESKTDDQLQYDRNTLTQLQDLLNTLREETGVFQHKMMEEFKRENSDLSSRLYARASSMETDLHRDQEAIRAVVEDSRQHLEKQLTYAREHFTQLQDDVKALGSQLKAGQQEIQVLKDDLAARERELKESRGEIRLVQNNLGAHKARQKTLWAAAAVAILLVPTLIITAFPGGSERELSQLPTEVAALEAPVAPAPTSPVAPVVGLASPETTISNFQGPMDGMPNELTDEDQIEGTPVRGNSNLTTVAFQKSVPEDDAQNGNAQDSKKVIEYVVKKDDSLWKIAKKYYKDGSKHEKIKSDNNLKSNDLKAGSKLRIYL